MEEDIAHLVSVFPQESAVFILRSEFPMLLMPVGISCIAVCIAYLSCFTDLVYRVSKSLDIMILSSFVFIFIVKWPGKVFRICDTEK